MTRPRTLPDDNHELERLLRRHTQQEVADMYGVSNQAVSKAIRDRELSTPRRASYKQWIPWTVKVEHSDHYLQRMLRLYAMAESGRELTPKQQGMLNKFKLNMGDDLVVQYDPGHSPVWFVVPRRPGIDTGGYARKPV